jgi:signal peptidase I
MLSIIVFASIILFQLGLTGLVLARAATWVRSPHATFGRGFLTAVIFLVYSIIGSLLQSAMIKSMPLDVFWLPIFFAVLILLGVLFFQLLFTRYIFALNWLRGVLVFLSSLIAVGITLCLVLFVVKTRMVETFITPSHSMSSALVAEHYEGVCPECNGLMLKPHRPGGFDAQGVCTKCKAVRHLDARMTFTEVQGADRFVVNKLLKPERWDIIAFRSTVEPETIYAQRLVGLPGETIAVREGAVWVNGAKQSPPDSVGPVKYLDGRARDQEEFGPHILKENEYFVLSDNASNAFDSRLFGAVLTTDLIGVVDLIYWPWKRIRLIR